MNVGCSYAWNVPVKVFDIPRALAGRHVGFCREEKAKVKLVTKIATTLFWHLFVCISTNLLPSTGRSPSRTKETEAPQQL
jgi:hypothetical protein